MKPCPGPGEGRWRPCSGPGSVCLRGPCWWQRKLQQVREVWKGAGRRAWALHGRVGRRRHQELPEWLRVEFGQKHNSWVTAERQVGAELCSRNESLIFGLQDEESFIHPVTLLMLGDSLGQQTTPWGEKSAVSRACEASTCLLVSAALVAGLWRLQCFSKHWKLLEILVPKDLQSESKEEWRSSKETRTREI